MDSRIETERLVLRPWEMDDAEAAYALFSDQDVTRWLTPVIEAVASRRQMEILLEQWVRENGRAFEPLGRWAVERRDDGQVIGGLAIAYLPPGDTDLGISWELSPSNQGRGYAREAAQALTDWALRRCGTPELLAVAHATNSKGISLARRLGMEWVGETDKYYAMRLQVFRLRASDLEPNAADHPEAFKGMPYVHP